MLGNDLIVMYSHYMSNDLSLSVLSGTCEAASEAVPATTAPIGVPVLGEKWSAVYPGRSLLSIRSDRCVAPALHLILCHAFTSVSSSDAL